MSVAELVVSDGVATITLRRPDHLNALDLTLARELLAAAREIAIRDDVDAIVLASKGRAFCAGGGVAEIVRSGDPSS